MLNFTGHGCSGKLPVCLHFYISNLFFLNGAGGEVMFSIKVLLLMLFYLLLFMI